MTASSPRDAAPESAICRRWGPYQVMAGTVHNVPTEAARITLIAGLNNDGASFGLDGACYSICYSGGPDPIGWAGLQRGRHVADQGGSGSGGPERDS